MYVCMYVYVCVYACMYVAISIQRVRAVQYFLQIAGKIYVCYVYFAAIAQVWINLHRQHVFYTVRL